MKITLIHPDLKESQIRVSERNATYLSSLFKRLGSGTIIKRHGQLVNLNKKGLLSKAFTDGDVVEVLYSKRRLCKAVKRSQEPCMITLDTVEERAEMPCGHAIAPQALYDYCLNELETGSSTITCPYVTNIKEDKCGFKWNQRIVALSAAMSKKEKTLFQTKLDKNRIKQQEVQSTNVYPDDQMISLLHNSPKLYRHGNVLMRRACPKCWSIIEHDVGCLSMTCRYPSCNFRFCFRCLGEYSPEYNHNTCRVAPLQFSSDR